MALAPLRLSINEDDPSFHHIAYSGKLKLTLNGVPQTMCIAYDRKVGWVDRIKCDPNGRAVVEGDEFVIERVPGVVSAWIED